MSANQESKQKSKIEKTERLFDEYATSLMRMCTLYLRDSELAQQAMKETFVKASQKADRFYSTGETRIWLMRLAVNQCKAILRKSSGRATFMDYNDEDYPMKNKLGEDTLSRKVMELPPKYREAVLLYYYQELTLKEIALVTGESVANVSVSLSRGRRRLTRVLKEWDYD